MPASALWLNCKDCVTYYTHPVFPLFLHLKDAVLCDSITARTTCVHSEAQTYMRDCWCSTVSVGGVTRWTCHTLLLVWCFPPSPPLKILMEFLPCCLLHVMEMWLWLWFSVDLWDVSPEVVTLLKAMIFFWSSSDLTTACTIRCYGKPQTLMSSLSDWSCG